MRRGTAYPELGLTNNAGEIVDSGYCSFIVSRPKPLWSEQNPQDWWLGFCHAMDDLRERNDLSGVKALGFARQMHGATLLDSDNKIIRPAVRLLLFVTDSFLIKRHPA